MAAPKPRRVIHSVAQLRDIVAQTEPGAHLLLEVHSEMPFEDVRQLWEAITREEGQFELYNLEMLRGKQEAADFVHKKIRGLEVKRDDCNGRIGCMNNWVLMMENSLRKLERVESALPEDYKATFMLGGPAKQFIDLDQIGKVDAKDNREEILRDFFDMPVKVEPCEEPYWDIPQVTERATRDRRSLVLFNINYLKVKIDVLKAKRDKLTKGINDLKGLVQGIMFMGCANAGLASFRDLPMTASDPMGLD